MFQRLLSGALIAGIGAGLVAALLHFVFVQDLILLGERYEMGEIVHFGEGMAHGHAAEGGNHDAHDHAHAPGEASTLMRNALTVGFTVALYAAYAMLLVAGFAVAAQFGLHVTAVQGTLWGLAGFAAFQLSPAMGLAPELPGTMAADIGARQVWWWGTLAATGIAAAMLGYGRSVVFAAIGAALLLAPHLIGAPVLDGFSSPAPAELGALFAARVLGVGLAAWLVLGWLAGWLWSRSS